jgi:molecular chaperone GrpE
MTDRDNGRTIRIPVRLAGHQLPVADVQSRPLLEGPAESLRTVAQEPSEEESAVDNSQGRVSLPLPGRDLASERAVRLAQLEIEDERRRLLTRMVSVADNLERALAHAVEGDALYTGIQLTLEDLRRQLGQEGVQRVEALGQRFDPYLHEAVATDGSDGEAVVEIVRHGYTLNGKLLRPARVVVGSLASFWCKTRP